MVLTTTHILTVSCNLINVTCHSCEHVSAVSMCEYTCMWLWVYMRVLIWKMLIWQVIIKWEVGDKQLVSQGTMQWLHLDKRDYYCILWLWELSQPIMMVLYKRISGKGTPTNPTSGHFKHFTSGRTECFHKQTWMMDVPMDDGYHHGWTHHLVIKAPLSPLTPKNSFVAL